MKNSACPSLLSVFAVVLMGAVAGFAVAQEQPDNDRLAWAVKLSRDSDYARQHCRELYVDPDCPAGGDGSEAKPWTRLAGAEWAVVENALSEGNVTVYFSARQADGDVAQDLGGPLVVPFSGHEVNRITLDGMSKYNADDAAPSWQPNTGKNKARLTTHSSLALGRPGAEGIVSNITFRGFEITGEAARIIFGGNNVILEHAYSHDITGIGPALHTRNLVAGRETSLEGPHIRYSNVIIRNCVIDRCYGEAMYIGGVYEPQKSLGNAHGNFLIENNVVRYAGVNGAQGDGIEIKVGLSNVTIRNNVVEHGTDMGIAYNGMVVKDSKESTLIEGNIIRACGKAAAALRMGGGWSYTNRVIVRNNVVYGNAREGIKTLGSGDHQVQDLEIYNNTVYDNGSALALSAKSLVVVNNLVFGNKGGAQARDCQTVSNDYNAHSGNWAIPQEGPHSIVLGDLSVLCMDPAKGDFHLKAGSPCINAGTDVGLTTDRDGKPRPHGKACDIGAYQF